MSKWTQYREIMRARREGAPLADIVVMKFAWYVDEKSPLNEQLSVSIARLPSMRLGTETLTPFKSALAL